jgi:hypothetical protein
MLHTKVVEEIKSHVFCSVTFVFEKHAVFLDNVEEYGRLEQATDDKMTHAHCMLDD